MESLRSIEYNLDAQFGLSISEPNSLYDPTYIARLGFVDGYDIGGKRDLRPVTRLTKVTMMGGTECHQTKYA